MDAVEATKATIDIVKKPLQDLAEAGAKAPTQFLSSGFLRGEAQRYKFETPIMLGEARTCDEDEMLNAFGIESLRCVQDNGWIYKYRFYISVFKSLKIQITCGEHDTYSCNCQTLGNHNIDFNSEKPGIYSIMVQYLG